MTETEHIDDLPEQRVAAQSLGMHDETAGAINVQQDDSGECPKCGMALEPKMGQA